MFVLHLLFFQCLFMSILAMPYYVPLQGIVGGKRTLVYLDSFDLDIDNPEPSQEHGLNEFLLLDKKLKKGAFLSIDDTPISYELFGNSKINKFDFIPGKGRLVLNYLDKNPNQYEILYHNYSLVLKKL